MLLETFAITFEVVIFLGGESFEVSWFYASNNGVIIVQGSIL